MDEYIFSVVVIMWRQATIDKRKNRQKVFVNRCVVEKLRRTRRDKKFCLFTHDEIYFVMCSLLYNIMITSLITGTAAEA